jgi:hypothetical protein
VDTRLIALRVHVHADAENQWLTFAPVSTKSADYFNVTETAINWLSTGFLFAFIVICPYVLSSYLNIHIDG